MKSMLLLLTITLLTSLVHLCAVAQNDFKVGFYGKESSSVQNFTVTEDGGSIVAFHTYATPGFFVAKLDAAGTLRWEKNYNISGNSYTGGLINTNDKGFVVLAYTNDSTALGTGAVIKCDSLGKVQWSKQLNTADGKKAGADAITQTRDGSYLIGSAYLTSESMAILKLNAKGNELWTKVYAIDGGDYGYNIDAIAETADDGGIMSVNVVSCEAYCEYNYLYKFDNYGVVTKAFDVSLSGPQSPVAQQIIPSGKQINILYSTNGISTGIPYYCYVSLDAEKGKATSTAIIRDIFTLKYFLQKNNVNAAKCTSFPQSSRTHLPFYGFKKNWQIEEGVQEHFPEHAEVHQYNLQNQICADYTTPHIYDSSRQVHVTLYEFNPAQLDKLTVVASPVTVKVTPASNMTPICSGKDAISTPIVTDKNLFNNDTTRGEFTAIIQHNPTVFSTMSPPRDIVFP